MQASSKSSLQRRANFSTFAPRENRRSALRYGLRAEVAFSWNSDNGTKQEGRGCTRDISPGGAYVLSPVLPPQGQSVRMSIYLPMFPGEPQAPCIAVRGRVLRAERGNATHANGFSVRNERVTLCAR